MAQSIDLLKDSTFSTKMDALAAAVQRSNGSTVSVNADYNTGTKIASVTIDELQTNIYAPIPDVQEVSVTQTITTGTEIGSISIDETETKLYAPTVSITQNGTSGNKVGTISVGSTNTDLYAPAAPTVTVTQEITSGTKLASISVGGTNTDIYAPSSVAPNAASVAYTPDTTNGNILNNATNHNTVQKSLTALDQASMDQAEFALLSASATSAEMAARYPDISIIKTISDNSTVKIPCNGVTANDNEVSFTIPAGFDFTSTTYDIFVQFGAKTFGTAEPTDMSVSGNNILATFDELHESPTTEYYVVLTKV